MIPPDWNGIRRLLVVRLDNIGDVIMLGPSLRCLKQSLPHARITLLASPAGAQAAPLLPWIDEVVVHSALWQQLDANRHPEPNAQLALIQELQSRHFDAAFIFTSFSQSPHPPAYACYLAGIPIRAGQSKEFGGAVLTHWVRALPDDSHQVDRNLYLLESLGLRPDDRSLGLAIDSSMKAAADRLLRDVGIEPHTPFIVLAAGASCAARRYDLQRAEIVVRELSRRTGLPVVVVGSTREQALLAPLTDNGAGYSRSLVGRTSVPELAAVIARATLLITNNSGPMHIADAFNTPMVALFAGTELASQWRPRRSPATLLSRSVACSPCYNFTCPYDMACLDLPPELVIGEALRLLQRRTPQHYVEHVFTHPTVLQGAER